MRVFLLIAIYLIPLFIVPASALDDSSSSEIQVGVNRELLQNEKGEWILYDKRYGYSITLPDWKFNVETDYRSRALVVVSSLDKTDARFSPVFAIQTLAKANLSYDSITSYEENLDKLIIQDFLNESDTEIVADIKINSVKKQILDDQIIVDISSKFFYPSLTPSNSERRTIYSDSGEIYQISFATGLSDYDDYISDYKESIETFDISYSKFRNFSPHKQVEQGLPAKAVLCDFEYILVLKLSDNTPACVKSSTYQKLAERGWTSWDLFIT